METYTKSNSRLTLVSLVAVNLIPLVGVLFYQWDIFTLMFLFWAESAVVGFYAILKFFKESLVLGLVLTAFFSIHFGGFMFIHLVFLTSVFGDSYTLTSIGLLTKEDLVIMLSTITIPLIALFVSHGISFIKHFVKKTEIGHKQIIRLMTEPYKRVGLMHITIIFGSFLVSVLNNPVFGLIILVLLKIMTDIGSHLYKHKPDRKRKSSQMQLSATSIRFIVAFLVGGPKGLVQAIKNRQNTRKSQDT